MSSYPHFGFTTILATLLAAAPLRADATVVMQFDLNGAPYPAALQVSDGETTITLAPAILHVLTVPETATYDITWQIAPTTGPATLRDLIPSLTLAPNELFEVMVHLHDETVPPLTPVIFIEEFGANAQLVNTTLQQGADIVVKSVVTGTPGKRVMLDTVLYESDGSGTPLPAFSCAAPCELLFGLGGAADAPGDGYTCSCTQYLAGDYYKADYNMCAFTVPQSGSQSTTSVFRAIAPGDAGVFLDAALRDGAIVPAIALALEDLQGGLLATLDPFSSRGFPDFVVPAGAYRLVSVVPLDGDPLDTYELVLPLDLGSGARGVLTYPPRPCELSPYEAVVVADGFLGGAVKSIDPVLANDELRILADVVGPAWVGIAVPPVVGLASITTDVLNGAPLAPDAWVRRPAGCTDLLVLRVEPGPASYIVSFEPPATWQDVGFALAGVTGKPSLVGTGTLVAGTAVSLEIANGAPNAPATLFVGLSTLFAPFKGGTLVPTVDITLAGIPLDAGGGVKLTGTWPAGIPAFTQLAFQAWIVDAAAVKGVSATNGVVATTP